MKAYCCHELQEKANKNQVSCKYQLKGVVIHVGQTIKSGHCFSYIKVDLKDDKSWYEFNDTSVYPRGEFSINKCFGGEQSNNSWPNFYRGEASLIFYEQVKQGKVDEEELKEKELED